jgi:ABC-type amino acid transport substrate-binding protein
MMSLNKKITLKIFIVFICIIVFTKSYATKTVFELSIGINPPYAISLNNKNIQGLAAEIIIEALKYSNIKYKISRKDVPWKRAVETSQSSNFLFYLFRTPDREGKYIWINPIFDDQTSVYNLKDTNVISSISNLKNLKLIGTLAGGAGESLLKSFGLERRIYYCKNDEQCIQLLTDGEIDAWISQNIKTKYLLKKLNIEKMFNKEFQIYDGQGWLASSLNMNKEDQREIRNSIKKFMTTPKYLRILKKFGVRVNPHH